MTLEGRARANSDARMNIASLTVLDIAPKHYAPHHRPLLQALDQLDITTLKSRSDADAALRASIPHAGTRAFLLKSLVRDGDSWRWAFALDRLVEDYDALSVPPPFVDPGNGSTQPPVLFVRGTQSDYLDDDDVPLLRRYYPRAQLQAVNAGHWLHAEKPAQIAELCEAFLGGPPA